MHVMATEIKHPADVSLTIFISIDYLDDKLSIIEHLNLKYFFVKIRKLINFMSYFIS